METNIRGYSWVEVLDRVLDKGIVIDAWVKLSVPLIGIDLINIEARVVVASIDTYLKYTDTIRLRSDGFLMLAPLLPSVYPRG